jgi:hypothetical protein
MLTGIGLATATQAAQPDKARVIVTFKAGAGPGAKAAINGAGGRVAVDLPDVNAVGAEVPASALQGLRRNPNVVSVDDDPIRRIAGYPAPKGTARIALLPGTAEQSPYGIAMVQADQVTDAPAADRKVCIIDSGIDRSHEDLQGIAGRCQPDQVGTVVHRRERTARTSRSNRGSRQHGGRDRRAPSSSAKVFDAAAAAELRDRAP